MLKKKIESFWQHCDFECFRPGWVWIVVNSLNPGSYNTETTVLQSGTCIKYSDIRQFITTIRTSLLVKGISRFNTSLMLKISRNWCPT